MNITKLKKDLRRQLLMITIFFMVLLTIALAIAPAIVKIVRPGEAGVLYKTFDGGTQTGFASTYGEGLHFIFPWDVFYKYDVRIHKRHCMITALTKDGLAVDVEISVRYSPNVNTLGLLHKYVGPDYSTKVVIPEVEATTRDIIGLQDLDSLYSDKRVDIQREISENAIEALNQSEALNNYETRGAGLNEDFGPARTERYIIFKNLFIENICLPPPVAEKIEQKIIAEQEFRRYEYLLAAEEEEKKRKLIEAKGIKLFEDSSSISILKWKGLQATEELAKSPNAKVIVIGTDENLPIILNGEGG